MSFTLEFLPQAKKEFKKLDKSIQIKIKEKLLILSNDFDTLKNNIKPLKGEFKNKFRLRVNDYRIIFQKKEDLFIILIVRIAHRKEIYKG